MLRSLFFRLVVTMCLLIVSIGCTPKTNPKSPSLEPSPTSSPAAFRVVAYATAAIFPAAIPYDKLTHINYAFLIPNEDGSFVDMLNNWKVGELVRLAHENKVKVLISVGGWGWDKQFEALAANPATRTAFVENLVRIVDEYQFDGADIDWEYPDSGASSDNFLALIQELRAALPKDRLLTAAVVALGEHGAGIPGEVFSLMDFINIMAYDEAGSQHSSLGFAQAALEYWLGRGLPPEKAVLGVPFYARPAEIPYSKIVKDDPAAAQLDSIRYAGMQINYNGIPTIQAKTRMAMQRASGIMFWTLEDDASGDLSLLTAIHQVVINSSQ
jgi:GH18 family chitinase